MLTDSRQHLSAIKASTESGLFTFGGGLLEAPPSETGGKLLINGSAMVAVADTEAEVRALLAKDVYAKTGVWDVENATVMAFKCAVRKPL